MTTPDLRTTPEALRVLAGRYRELATGLSPGHVGGGAGWQESAVSVATGTVTARAVAATMTQRLEADATVFDGAARDFSSTDAQGVADMDVLGQGLYGQQAGPVGLYSYPETGPVGAGWPTGGPTAGPR